MRNAQLPDGQPVEANEQAPQQGVCPHCGGIVHLRKRRLMNNQDVVYYWRHQANQNNGCPARRRPADY